MDWCARLPMVGSFCPENGAHVTAITTMPCCSVRTFTRFHNFLCTRKYTPCPYLSITAHAACSPCQGVWVSAPSAAALRPLLQCCPQHQPPCLPLIQQHQPLHSKSAAAHACHVDQGQALRLEACITARGGEASGGSSGSKTQRQQPGGSTAYATQTHNPMDECCGL